MARNEIRGVAMMANGATVADWLGTAATAASVASMYLHDVRNGIAGAGKLLEARELLSQALYEADELISFIAEAS
jgi:hypothetical protein